MAGLRYALLAAALAAALPAYSAPAAKQLTIVKAAVRQYEDGPALGAGFSFLAGDTVFFSFQIQGYQVSPDAEIDLETQIDAIDPEGTPLMATARRRISTQVSAEDKNWLPIVRESIQVPPLALPGTYRILVVVEDKLSKQAAKAEVEFSARGRQVERSETVVARNFRFLRAEEDRDALAQPVYRPGDALWARFDITGFRYGPNNRVQVSYSVSVADPSGKTVFSQPQPAVEQDESFYPKRYVPGVFSLQLDKKVKPGEYTLVLALRDEIGNQADESRHVFRIE
jgi:hypothetical protein